MHFYPDKSRAHNPLPYLVMASAMFWMAVFFMPLPAMAQDAGERFSVQRVAVIDLARIIRESEATERVRALLDIKSEEFQKEFAENDAPPSIWTRRDSSGKLPRNASAHEI